MILESIKAENASRVLLTFTSGEELRVSVRTVADAGLYAGKNLSEEDLTSLRREAAFDHARQRAAWIASAAPSSERDLKRKLVRRGESPEAAEAAAEWLKGMGGLDDGAYARRLVARSIRQGYGRQRAQQELRAKGIPQVAAEAALTDYPDMTDAAVQWLEKKGFSPQPDRREKSRMADGLRRRGFSWDEIQSAVALYQTQHAGDTEETDDA